MKKFPFTALRSRTQNRQLIFSPKTPYDLVAERSEATTNLLTFPKWCAILKIVRTHFAAEGGEEAPKNSERLRRVLY
ncbi:hypothetical protein BMS3Abin15_00601 [bacterium BMS3Abin15]|nr:hypothetical protein BMS3Abin15_00601 [bacterium BMS3Abin15]HDZ85734.1 hypothetical protein [Candidatus Moranbacteria bacterium]